MAFTGKFFNTNYYLTQNADVAAKWGSTALNHYVTNGAAEGRSPNAWFDYQYYRANNADLASMTAIQLFEHYENFGYKEGRATAAAYANFNEQNYLDTYSDLGKAGITTSTALNHYLTFGITENRVAKNDDGTTVTSSTQAVTYALTTGVDNIMGAATNDTIDGSRAVLAGQVLNSLNNSDSIDGGAGTDTLFVQHTENLQITPASLKNVEVISTENLNAAAQTLDLVNGDGSITTVKSANNVAAQTITNIQSAPGAFELSTSAVAFTAGIATTKLTGTADAATLKLTNVTGAAAVTIGNVAATGGNGYETISITSAGTVANSIALDDTAGAAAAGTLATINIMGSNNLTLASAANMTTVTKVDASTFTGALTYTAATGNAKNMMVTGGTGNDTINVGVTAGDYTINDSINGGTGTDTLIMLNADLVGITAAQTNLSNVEFIGASAGINGAASVDKFTGVTGLVYSAASAGNSTITYAAGTNNLNFGAFAHTHTLGVTINGVATTDVLNLTLGSATTASGNNSGVTTFSGAETMNIVSQGGANTLASLQLTSTGAHEKVVITGSQTLTITTSAGLDEIDASGMTGTAGLIMGGNTHAASQTFTGTGNADTIYGSTAADIISGGAGADTLYNAVSGTGASKYDVLTGGAGFDTFVLHGDTASGAVATILLSTSYITDFTVGSTAATTDIIGLSATEANYANTSTLIAGQGAQAAGATAVQSIAQSNGATALIAGTDLIKLTTAVTTAGTFQVAFDTAIGTSTFTGAAANDDYFFTLYDSTNSRMLIGTVNAAGGGATTTVETADVVSLVGSVSMTAADYASFGAANFAITA
jgi:hypothetical protein